MNRGGSIVLAAAAWLLGTAGPAPAQDVNPPRAARPAAGGDGLLNNEIDDLLQRWHDKTKNVTSLYATFKRTVYVVTFKKKRENEGTARFREPNLARLDIKANEKGEGRELFILSEQPRPRGGKGLEIRHYVVGERNALTIHEFPDDAVRNAQEEGPLRLLFGIKPATAHQRYSFDIQKKTADAVTVRITPKLEADRQEFLEAVLSLDTKTFMPRELRVQENVDTVVTYAFSRIHTNVDTPELEISPADFNPPKIDEKAWVTTRQAINPGRPQGQAGARKPAPRP